MKLRALLLELCYDSYDILLILISFSFDEPTFFQLLIFYFPVTVGLHMHDIIFTLFLVSMVLKFVCP